MSDSETDPTDVLASLKDEMQSVLLSTIGEDGNPHSGYTPFIFDNDESTDHHIIIFVSQLALHTRDLLATGKASAFLIADESKSEQIFARTRVSYQCDAKVVEQNDERYEALLTALQSRHGKMIGLLKTLPDFVMFRLVPTHGQFVMGFGQAFKLSGNKFSDLELSRRA